jgi:glyoxylase-like metal-dependent hydrolase (beta-lactamase superfamily II)
MKIHHLNCGTLYPRFPRGTQSILYCLLAETNDGLLLVDSGFGTQDYQNPTWFTRIFISSLGMPRAVEETAAYQVERLGYSRNDVRHIVMTHLHSDHAGGLRDFPGAQVHVHRLEIEAARSPKGFIARFYDPAQWSHQPMWVIHEEADGMDWFGLSSIRIQEGLSPDVRLVPLPGHTPGHCGVAVETSQGWILHCGDATYPFYQQNDPSAPFKPLPSYVISPPKWLEKNLLGENTPVLKKLYDAHGDQIQFICSNALITFSRQEQEWQ